MKYTIYDKTVNKKYELKIHEIFEIIKKDPLHIFMKQSNNELIEINNNLILNTTFICHRINTLNELLEIPTIFGVELDIRDDYQTKTIILSHDPFNSGEQFDSYLKDYKHKTLILNIKSERTELQCIELMKQYNIQDYFFLDSNLPMIYLLNQKYNNTNIACRFSEFESFENYLLQTNMISWIWIDSFNNLPINKHIYNIIKTDLKKICIVSPDLHNESNKIKDYRNYIINNQIIPDAICCKIYNIINWI
jgi:hypothetical protein